MEQSGELTPMVMRSHELALPLTGCSTQKSRPFTLTGEQVELALGGMGEGELALMA